MYPIALAIIVLTGYRAASGNEPAASRIYIEPTGPLIILESQIGGFDVTRSILNQKGCPLIVANTPVKVTYTLRFEGTFNWTLFENGDAVSAFRVWPVTAGKVAKKVCGVVIQRRKEAK